MHYTTMEGEVKAVDDVSFSVEKGEAVGLAGESGCGKSSVAFTLLKLLPKNARIVKGKVLLSGSDILTMSETDFRRSVRWKRISMVPQAAMNALDPVFKIGEQIAEAIMVHEEVTEEEATERTAKLLEMVGIDPSRADRYPHEFSGGMKQRSMIAMALACNPDLVLADEPTTALDVVIQSQVIKVLKNLQKVLGLSMILISHDLSVVGETCDKVAIMYAGKICEYSRTRELFESPLHPYAEGLLSAFPKIKGLRKRLISIPGNPPQLVNPPTGCRFHPRCKYARPVCSETEPQAIETTLGHWTACHKTNKHPKY
jgi:peptide/nickel transport system ATP-binding protein